MTGRIISTSGHQPGRYIPAIDGLRAVAVLSVLAYHLKIAALPGGFTGVDVFFVISGYLISGIIFRDIAAGRFSYRRFYERRIRRIAPALIATLVVTTTIFLLVFSPAEFDDYVKSLCAATLSVSNFYFYLTVNYFRSAADIPLLHTWSLAVEEQFYFIFPALVVLGCRYLAPRRFSVALLVVGLASLACSVYLTWNDPSAAFYFPTSRLWELIAGAILARLQLTHPRLVPARKWLSWLGALGVILSMVLIKDTMRFPGFPALLPVLSACALIAGAANTSLPNSVLSSHPVRWVGKISYSLYLIHWPIITFLGCLFPVTSLKVTILTPVLSISLAWASWRFIESPFRRPQQLNNRLFAGFAACCLLVPLMALIDTRLLDGFWNRYPQVRKVQAYYRYDANVIMRESTCFLTSASADLAFYKKDLCLALSASSKNVLLIGDSHSADLIHGLATVFPSINFLQASASGCDPTLNPAGSTYCMDLVNYIYRDWLPAHRREINTVILSAVWFRGRVNSLEATLRWLSAQGIEAVVLGPSPEFSAPLPRLLAYAAVLNSAALIDRFTLPGPFDLDNSMKADSVVAPHYISIADAICKVSIPKFNCKVTEDGQPLLFDRDHFTDVGAVRVVSLLKSQLEGRL